MSVMSREFRARSKMYMTATGKLYLAARSWPQRHKFFLQYYVSTKTYLTMPNNMDPPKRVRTVPCTTSLVWIKYKDG